MIPRNRIPSHPGEILVDQYLRPLGLTQVEFASHIGVSVQRVTKSRAGWDAAVSLLLERHDDHGLEEPASTRFDDEEWEW